MSVPEDKAADAPAPTASEPPPCLAAASWIRPRRLPLPARRPGSRSTLGPSRLRCDIASPREPGGRHRRGRRCRPPRQHRHAESARCSSCIVKSHRVVHGIGSPSSAHRPCPSSRWRASTSAAPTTKERRSNLSRAKTTASARRLITPTGAPVGVVSEYLRSLVRLTTSRPGVARPTSRITSPRYSSIWPSCPDLIRRHPRVVPNRQQVVCDEQQRRRRPHPRH